MYRNRSKGTGNRTGVSKSELGTLRDSFDRKRINDALDKNLEKSSLSVTKGGNAKDKDPLSFPSTSAGRNTSIGDSWDVREARKNVFEKTKYPDDGQ